MQRWPLTPLSRFPCSLTNFGWLSRFVDRPIPDPPHKPIVKHHKANEAFKAISITADDGFD